MTAYFRRDEIEVQMQQLVISYAEECLSQGQINRDFIELIKHNFLAKYVLYDPKKKVVEIGINESGGSKGLYPNIKVHHFSIDKVQSWVGKSFKYSKGDLEFYGKLLAGNTSLRKPEVMVE